MNEYTVTIMNTFEAETPEEAVEQMVSWLQEAAAFAGYNVINDNTNESMFIDAERMTTPSPSIPSFPSPPTTNSNT